MGRRDGRRKHKNNITHETQHTLFSTHYQASPPPLLTSHHPHIPSSGRQNALLQVDAFATLALGVAWKEEHRTVEESAGDVVAV